jgi:SAM-dependent methyltransferase
VKSDSGVASPFHTQFVQGVLVAADELAQGEDAVMGAGSTTGELFAAGLPRRRLGSMLDLGCGAGACALAMAAHADRVVGTDINPRAIVLGRMNAMLNGIANAEFREGDLFAPVDGERFDLILSQPPFVAMPDGATARTYLYGGRRGDELPLRVIAQAPAYLAETGRAIVLVDFPLPDGEGVCAIVSSALAGRANAVLVQQEHDADTDAIACAASQFPELGAEFAAAVVARREHFARMGVDRLALTFTVLERPRGPETWVAATPLFWRDEQHLGAPWLDALFAAHELVARGPDAILAARLHAPEGARFVEGEDGAVDVAFPADRPVESVELTRDAYDLVATLQESESVRHAFATLAAKQESATPEEAAEVLLPVVVEMLQRGVLEVD